uniref:Apple domain-containing protein n=1 Tax=Caenorhabditis japonica TaxID=281687 RepID=A0A8R1DEY4_CAEJA
MTYLFYLFFFLSPSSLAQHLSEILAQNPLLAELSMFRDAENSTIALPSSAEEFVEEDLTTKKSRSTVSDNFDERYYELNATLFDQAEPELGDLDYHDLASDSTLAPIESSPDDVDLQKAIEDEETTPFSASSTLFETPVGSTGFARSSETSSTSLYFSSTTTTPSELSEQQVEQFFIDQEPEDDVVDISIAPVDVTTASMPYISTASFQGSNYMKLLPLGTGIQTRQDENEVVQYNGKYSVSATKYYVDNRVDGEHFEDPNLENTVEDVDPFAVEREMRKVARMHAAKTQVAGQTPLSDDAGMGEIWNREPEEKAPDEETLTMDTDANGKQFETRETVYNGQKTTVKLWNKNLYGHDLMRFPGAIFDYQLHQPTDKRRAVASRIVLSSEDGDKYIAKRLRNVVDGVTNVQRTDKVVVNNDKERRTTEDVESVCFNTKRNVAIGRISPFDTEENVTKLECLIKCARTDDCTAATYSVSLATCAMYSGMSSLASTSIIRSQGHTLHRKLPKTTLRCVRMFVSKEFLPGTDGLESQEVLDLGQEEEEIEVSPPFLRLVEKDGHDTVSPASARVLFAQQPRCPEGQDVVFVRSDNVEAAHHQERRSFVEITEDDCVFACLTNTRPGGGNSDCTAIEYDKKRGFCYLMSSPPGDVAMTPTPVHPVTTYEKICIQQKSANKCSGGQPIRFRQKVLIGHLVDAHSTSSAAECVDLCIEKNAIGCVSAMFYAKETTLNCILNDATHLDDAASFYDENATIVDFFAIQDCLGIREVNRRAKKR